MLHKTKLITILSAYVLISGCASLNSKNTDPLELYNRQVFALNTMLDKALVGHIAAGYRKFIPSPIRTSISNFFKNIDTVPAILNDFLQARPKLMVNDFGRLIINTTFGIGGLFDVAQHGGLNYNPQSFSKTLYVWGWKDSHYFILPFMGPSTIRGAFSLVPEYYISPIKYIKPNWASYSLNGVKYLNIASIQQPLERKIIEMSIDPYIAIRNTYMQNLKFRLNPDGHNHDIENINKKTSDSTYI